MRNLGVDVTGRTGSYHRRMSTDKFAMEPEGTLSGLMSAGQERAAALATGLPAIQAGNYTAGYQGMKHQDKSGSMAAGNGYSL